MLPSFLGFNGADRLFADTKGFCDGKVTTDRMVNGERIRFCQFGVRADISLQSSRAALVLFVSHVVGMRAEEKMVRIDATWVVASVANAHPLRDVAVGKRPTHAVSQNLLAGDSEAAIAIFDARANPIQAAICAGAAVRGKIGHPMTGRHDWPRVWISHSLALLWRLMVRAGTVLDARFRPALSTINCDLTQQHPMRNWRPGAPHRNRWDDVYRQSLSLVTP